MKKPIGSDIQSLVNIVKEWSIRQPRVSKTYLFGSRVKNTHRDDSDLDVAVELLSPKGRPGGFCDWVELRATLTSTLGALLPVKLHLELYENEVETPTIHTGILEASILVYLRESSS